MNAVNPNALRVIVFHLGVQPNGEEITMSAFERLLAIADEETLDLARAMIGKPELGPLLLATEALKNTTEVLSPTTVAEVLGISRNGATDKIEDRKLRDLRTTGVGRLNILRFAREVESSHKESPRLDGYD
jgi:hypothetical protein